MRRLMVRLLEPLRAPVTYRRWGFLVLGGATYWPYVVAAAVLVSMTPSTAGQVAVGVVLAGVAPVVTAWVPVVRALEGNAARTLLGGPIIQQPTGPSASWPDRWRTAGFFLAHLLVGMLVCLATMIVLTVALEVALTPLSTRTIVMLDPLGLGRLPGAGSWRGLWAPPVATLGLAGLVYGIAAVGNIAAFFAPVLLGPSPEERAARLEQHARRLAERNRLARELHDSVGHALSVVTVQAAAAGRVLDTNPDFARDALDAIQTAARRALGDLDHVLGILRQETPNPTTHPSTHPGTHPSDHGQPGQPHAGHAGPAPAPGLDDLDALLATTRAAGVTVHTTRSGDLDAIPTAVSREAYRIIQEGLTNALRHAGAVPVTLEVTVRQPDATLDLTLTNPRTHTSTDQPAERSAAETAGEPPPEPDRPEPDRPETGRRGGGRGLTGIRERVTVLGGTVTAAAEPDGTWRLTASLPLRSTPPAPPSTSTAGPTAASKDATRR